MNQDTHIKPVRNFNLQWNLWWKATPKKTTKSDLKQGWSLKGGSFINSPAVQPSKKHEAITVLIKLLQNTVNICRQI